MKWIKNSIASLILLSCFFPDVRSATKEEMNTVILRFYKGNNIENYIDAHLEEAEYLVLDIDPSKPTVIYIHGFTEGANSTSVKTIVNAYCNRKDHNVIILEWSVIAGQNYLRVVGNAESVGAALASAVNAMIHAGLLPEKLHLVGHSMGAQVAAFAARQIDFPIPRITGLDPAGPLYNLIEQRLTESDAQFVDIIHTDFGFYGIARETGNTDFFPNGGRRIQPGCPLRFILYSKEDFCSHHRSWTFYAESLEHQESFLAVPCSHGMQSSQLKPNNSDPIVMGYATPTDAKGTYCLVTGSSAPYGRGIEGARLG